RRLQDLREPVHELHVRIAPQLAEDRCALERLERHLVELAERGGTTDLGHRSSPTRASAPSASSTRSLAGVPWGRSPSQLVHPSRPASPSVTTGTSSATIARRRSHAYSKPT